MDGVGNGQYYSYWIERLSGFDDGRTIVAGVLDGRKKKAKKQKAKGKKKRRLAAVLWKTATW
jgi:hypothetical protein